MSGFSRRLLCLILLAIFSSQAIAEDASPTAVYGYDSINDVPQKALDAYRVFIEAAKKGEQRDINELLLPYSIDITTEPRISSRSEYGADINIPFFKAKGDFTNHIFSITKRGDCCLMIRNGSSALSYVLTAQGEWKLYRYVDKPLE